MRIYPRPMLANLINYFKKDFLPEIFAALLFGISIEIFAAPNNIVSGGVTGVATIINYLTDAPIGTTSVVLNIPILLLAYKYLGVRFLLNTIRVLLYITISTDYIMALFPSYQGDLLIAAIFGGALIGGSLAIILNRGGSTGGTDILVQMINMRYPHLGLGKVVMLTDLVVVALGVFVYREIEIALYSIVMIYIAGEVIDRVIKGADHRWAILLVSTKRDEISQRILTEVRRGTTLMDAKGGYSNVPIGMLFCITDSRELFTLKKLIIEVDPDAFVVVAQAAEILGNGFKSIIPPGKNKTNL